MSYLSMMPNMTVMAPKNGQELREMLLFSLNFGHPLAIRYPRGEAETAFTEYDEPLSYGKAEVLNWGDTAAVLSFGDMLPVGMEISENLKAHNISPTVVNMRFVKPWDRELITELTETHRVIVTLEDGAVSGGVGERIASFVNEISTGIKVLPVGIPDRFVPQGEKEELMKLLGMDAETVTRRVLKELNA